MKATLVLLSLIATSAFASVSVQYQTIGGVPANNLCDAGSSFKTIKPVVVCEKSVTTPAINKGEFSVPSETKCLATASKQLDISKKTKKCVDLDARGEMYSGCTKYVAATQSSTVSVETVMQAGEITDVKYSTYTIPACASGKSGKKAE